MKKVLPYILTSLNLITLFFLLFGFSGKIFNSIEVDEVIIKDANGGMRIGKTGDIPGIAFTNREGKLLFEAKADGIIFKNPDGLDILQIGYANESGYITLQNTQGKKVHVRGSDLLFYGEQEKISAHIGMAKDGSAHMRFADPQQNIRLHLQGGEAPGVFLKNSESKTVGSWSLLSDGGTGIGLGDNAGKAAAIIRGGATPSVSFFNPNNEPMAALGMIQKIPHLLISGPAGNEGILIHGGKPSSMVVVDEVGKIKILISKHGVFQGKEQEDPTMRKKENKVFSLEDKQTLFPESDEENGAL